MVEMQHHLVVSRAVTVIVVVSLAVEQTHIYHKSMPHQYLLHPAVSQQLLLARYLRNGHCRLA